MSTRLHGKCRTRRGVLRAARHPHHTTTISGYQPYILQRNEKRTWQNNVNRGVAVVTAKKSMTA
jgi:hypothetical protein